MAAPLALLPLLGKTALWGGTALGGATGATALMGYPDQVRRDVLANGPDPISGEFNTNWWQNLLIDENSLMPQYEKLQRGEAYKDPTVRQMRGLLGADFNDSGLTASDMIADNSDAYKKANRQDQFKWLTELQTAQYNSPQAVRERERQDQLRSDQLNLQRDTMLNNDKNRHTTLQLGQINARTAAGNQSLQRQLSTMQNNTTLQLAQMDSELADKRMAYDRETRRMDRRDKNIAQLMAGIGQLGGAFSL
jgi:pimeloyl-ACP methyl ester carboxylesterase